jgi:Myb/SANT-like DNA-binding domain
MSKRKKSPQKKKKSISDRKTRKQGVHWSDEDAALLVEILVHKKDDGEMSENGFKASVWKDVADELEERRPSSRGAPKEKDSCKGYWHRVSRRAISIYLQY